jgi:hypothetical protein
MPKTSDITNRIITFKDLYGAATNSSIILVTRSGDTFEDGTFSTFMSNNYQSLTFYAGQPGKWLTLNSNSSASSSTALPPNLSTILMSSGTITGNLVSSFNISTTFGYISSLTVDSLSFGIANGFINMGDVITTSLSTIQTFTSSLLTTNLQVGIVSSLSYIAFPGLQSGYSQSIVAEQSTGTGTQELLLFKGSTNTDRIRIQTTGTIVFEPGVSARVFPSAPSNVTPAMIINASSNVGIGIAAPTVTLDVAGAGRFTVVSTNTISTNQVNSSNICNAGWLSNGGALSNLGGTAYFAATSNTTTLGVAGTATLAALTTTSHSNSGLLCNNGVFSNLVGTAYFAATSNTGILQVGGILTAASNITQNAGTTTLTGLSVNTISTNFISACNISTNSISTNFGFFSTISAGTLYGKYVGDGSLLTNLTVAGVTSILSTQAFYTSSISSSYITSQQGYISSLTVDNLAIGSNYGYVNMGDIVATSLSTIGIQAHTIFTDLITSAGTTLDLSGASINMYTSSIQQYLNFVPCPQPVIQFGSWSAPACGTDGTNIASPETISITSYGNTNYCIYITGKDSTYHPTYTAVPINANSFYVYYGNGNQYGSNVFYWQTMGYYGASAGPVQGSGGGGGGGTGTGTGH